MENTESESIPSKSDSPKNTWYCYILRNKLEQYRFCTYNGSTNDPFRRLRQHNEEIKGGARATHGKGGAWEIYVLFYGFRDHINTLSCEWRIKCPTGRPGKRQAPYNGVVGRVRSLNTILPLEFWTKQCTVSNRECEYTLLIAEDVAHHLDRSAIPANITVRSVPVIGKEHLPIIYTP